jgi:hypothetical protein
MYMWWLRLGGPAPQIFQNLRGADSWESRRNPAAAFAVHVRSGNLDGNMYMCWQRLGGPAPQIFQHLRGADSWESRRNPAAASIVHICSGGIYMRNVSVPGKAWPHSARSAPAGGGLGGPGYLIWLLLYPPLSYHPELIKSWVCGTAFFYRKGGALIWISALVSACLFGPRLTGCIVFNT